VEPDAFAHQFLSEDFHCHVESAFGGGIGAVALERAMRADRSGYDDRAAAPHQAQCLLQSEHTALEVDRVNVIPILRRYFAQRSKAAHSGVDVDYIDPAIFRLDLLDDLLARGDIGNIG